MAYYCVFLEILSSTPTAQRNMTRLVPPALIKGRVWPVVGAMLATTAIFIIACMPITEVIPAARRLPKRSLQRMAMRMPLYIKNAYAAISSTQPTCSCSAPVIAEI